MDEWLKAVLVEQGRIDAPGTGRRKATPGRCERCRARVVRGLDADRAGVIAECDMHEIDARGELVALAIGLRTYTLTRDPRGGWNVNPRDRWTISGGQRTALLVEHRCGLAIPPARESHIPQWMQAKPLPEIPPF